jgi:hypothetical protein
MVLPKWLKDEIKKQSNEKGIGMSEFIKDILKESVRQERKP